MTRSTTTRPLHPETLAIRAQAERTHAREHAVPLYLTSSFVFDDAEQARALFADEETGNVYSRFTNPNVDELVRKLCLLEGVEDGVATASGMAAVFATLAAHLSSGDHVVASRALFGANHQVLTKILPRWGVETTFVDASAGAAEWERALRPETRLLFVETPSNPGLELVDLAPLGELCRARGLLLVVDNCFATPLLQQPARFGAHLVIHSLTKWIDGQGRTLGGAVVGEREHVAPVRTFARQTGPALSPFNAWVLSRSLETLGVRMERHVANALRLACHFEGHPAVAAVRYPFLESHPQHALARRQMVAGGGIVALELAGGLAHARSFLDAVELVSHSGNLGDTRTIVTHPASTTHAKLTEEERARVRVTPGLVRVSVGLEHVDDVIADLEQALERGARAATTATRRAPRVRTGDDGAAGGGVDVLLLGVGAIGRELLAQLAVRRDPRGAPVRVCGLVDSTGFLVDGRGLSRRRLAALAAHKGAGRALAELPGALAGDAVTALDALDALAKGGLARPVLVDATAADTGAVLERALATGWDVVLANKVPLAGRQDAADRLGELARRHGRQLLHEATVGAGLPVLDTLRKLQETGDRVRSIEGCPSGTLGYLFGELGRGLSFSAALRGAMEAGYTEPDPRADLSGLDVARKALILARLVGFRGDLADVAVESLVPDALRAVPLDEFLARAPELDAAWDARVAEAHADGRVLRYRARVTPRLISVGLVAVERTDPLGALTGTDNQFSFTTARYHAQPLVITGPGAGAAVTAAGVFNDLLRLVELRGAAAGGIERRAAEAGA